jgi:DNA-binding LacI/PurR family transcriptional regulator
MQAIRDAGLAIPGDISIVGFDEDLPSRYVNPPLTTVTNPAASLGAAASRLLRGALQGHIALEPAPVLPVLSAMRDSCRPA